MTRLTMEEVDGALGKMRDELASIIKRVTELERKLEEVTTRVNGLSVQVRAPNRKP